MPTPRQHVDHAARQRAYRQRQLKAREAELGAKGLPPAPPISTMPSSQRWAGLLATARAALHTAEEEMSAYYEDRSEAWQESERGETMKEHIEALESLIEGLDTLELSGK